MRRPIIQVEAVMAYRCPICHVLHADSLKAQTCCTCQRCGSKFKVTIGWSRYCFVCQARDNVRHARARVKRLTAELEEAKQTLDDLLEDPGLAGRKPAS